jgi:hypothetical protein
MFRFTIRELLLLTLVFALAVGWFADATNKSLLISRMQLVKDEQELKHRLDSLEYVLRELFATKVEFLDDNTIGVVETLPAGTERRRQIAFCGLREPKKW